MAEISAKPYFHRHKPKTHTFAKFHIFITFAQKVTGTIKNRKGFQVRLFFCIINFKFLAENPILPHFGGFLA